MSREVRHLSVHLNVFIFSLSESSNKENNESPEWSFTTVRKKKQDKSDSRTILNGNVSTTCVCYFVF